MTAMTATKPSGRDQRFHARLRARGEQPVADLAHRAAAAGPRGHEIARPRSASGCASATATPSPAAREDRRVRRVVADAGALLERRCRALQRVRVERGELVVDALEDVADAELARAARDRGRARPEMMATSMPAAAQPLDAVAVAHVEDLERFALRRRSTAGRRSARRPRRAPAAGRGAVPAWSRAMSFTPLRRATGRAR